MEVSNLEDKLNLMLNDTNTSILTELKKELESEETDESVGMMPTQFQSETTSERGMFLLEAIGDDFNAVDEGNKVC